MIVHPVSAFLIVMVIVLVLIAVINILDKIYNDRQ